MLTDDRGIRVDMTTSWLAQMGWEIYLLYGGYDGSLEIGAEAALPKIGPSHRYRRPYEGTEVVAKAMQAFLDWEYTDLSISSGGTIRMAFSSFERMASERFGRTVC